MKLIRDLLRPYRAWLAIILFALLVETAMSLAAPWPLKIALDSAVGRHPLPSWALQLLGHRTGDHRAMIAAAAGVGLAMIGVLGSLAKYLGHYYTENVGQRLADDLRMRVFHHLDRLSLAYFDRQQSGGLLSTITTDISTIQGFASEDTLEILIDCLTILSMLGLMFWLNADFALLAVAILPLILIFAIRFKQAVTRVTHELRHRQSEVVTVVQEGLQSMRVMQAYGREDLAELHLRNAGHAAVEAALRARRVKSLLSPVVTVIVSLGTAYVLYRGVSLVLVGAMTIGALTVFLSYLNKFFKPVLDLATMTNSTAQAAVAVARVQSLLAADQMIPEAPNASEPAPFKGEIVFERVAFSYEPGAPVLRDISFTITPGQHVGFVGVTGGGKSTVASLIPRYYDPTAGRVLVDGVDVRQYRLQSLRSQVGIVLQDTVLFEGTIAENIAYGRPSATRQEIIEAAREADAHEFITRMPKGYDGRVGERGLTLSGGQRQRIGIARALIRNAPILILDEPTAALDAESEGVVLQSLAKLMRGRTAIAIAHRLSTVRDADNIIVFKDGIVAEQGAHQELLALGGVYADLYRVQFRSAA